MLENHETYNQAEKVTCENIARISKCNYIKINSRDEKLFTSEKQFFQYPCFREI